MMSNVLYMCPRGMAGEYSVPDSVTIIEDYAFKDCDSLTSVTIPDTVTSIGEFAFYGCDALTSVTLPNSITSIEPWVFCSCPYLTAAGRDGRCRGQAYVYADARGREAECHYDHFRFHRSVQPGEDARGVHEPHPPATLAGERALRPCPSCYFSTTRSPARLAMACCSSPSSL